jgi:predicted nucleotidyltransferase
MEAITIERAEELGLERRTSWLPPDIKILKTTAWKDWLKRELPNSLLKI